MRTQLWLAIALTADAVPRFDASFRMALPLPVRLVVASQRFVYIIHSRTDSTRFYTGLTSDVAARVAVHNAGRCRHTASAKPWEVVVAIEFSNEQGAIVFEKYLKSGSGVAFSKRHFRQRLS